MQGGLTRRRRYARALGRTQRGAVAVEAALITPLICLIVFGAVEFGFYFKEAHTVSSATTRGARELSALPKQNGYQDRVATLTGSALSALNGDEFSSVQVVIYKADTSLGHLGDGTLPPGVASSGLAVWNCTQRCWKYVWDSTAKKLTPLVGGGYSADETNTANPQPWRTSQQWACAPDPNGNPDQQKGQLDTGGVWIKAHFKPLTPLFGWLERDIITHAVFPLEPVADQSACTGSDGAPPAVN